jgi:hypothetical protein
MGISFAPAHAIPCPPHDDVTTKNVVLRTYRPPIRRKKPARARVIALPPPRVSPSQTDDQGQGAEMHDDAEREPGQHPLVHETPAEPEPLDSNERADDAAEVVQPTGEPVERDSA